MTDASPPQPDVFREAPHYWVGDRGVATGCNGIGQPPRWNSDHEWAVAKVRARWEGRKEPDDVDLAFARAVLAELGGV